MKFSEESLIQDVITAYDHELTQWKEPRESSQHNYDYYRGNQWVRYPEEKAKLKKLGVPTLSYNQILPIIILIHCIDDPEETIIYLIPGKNVGAHLPEIITWQVLIKPRSGDGNKQGTGTHPH